MDENVSLNWNNYTESFLENLKSFQKKECLCDSTIACQGKFYPVHRLVLSLCSSYFEKIFERTPCKHPFIIVKDIEPIHLEALLNFIYQGEVQVSKRNLTDFMKAAETLKIKGLLQNNSDIVYRRNNDNYNRLSNNNLNLNYQQNNHHNLNLNYRQNNHIIEDIISSKNDNSNGKLCLESINTEPCSLPINLNVPIYVKKNIKSTRKRNHRPKKKSKSKLLVKTKKVKSVQQNKTGRNKVKKLYLAPLRKSSRESVPKVSYYIPDEEVDEPDSEISIRENGTSQITIASYSGGNREEFDNNHVISDPEVENITIKVESTDYILDDIDYCHPDLEDEANESINTSTTKSSQEFTAAVYSQANGMDINHQSLVSSMVTDLSKQSVATSRSLTLKKGYQRKKKKKNPSVHNNINGNVNRPDYVCPFCGKSCLMNSLYLCHLRKHTGERPFACPHCDYKATQKHHVKGHIERRHKEI